MTEVKTETFPSKAFAAQNATSELGQLRFHIEKALENGVTKDELVEGITHLAFYSGWPNAMSATMMAKEISSKRDASQ
jgi:4-carboxymuconolactone decarboxylase